MVSLTIPIFNEREAILPLFEKVLVVMRALGRPWELIFVNDGSLDGSDVILDQLAGAHPEVKVVHFRRNFGQTAALMAGFDFASGEVVIPMDGDGQNDPADIPRMLAKLDNSRIEAVFQRGLHEYIEDFITENNRLGHTITEQYLQ